VAHGHALLHSLPSKLRALSASSRVESKALLMQCVVVLSESREVEIASVADRGVTGLMRGVEAVVYVHNLDKREEASLSAN
jgi:hypothetical protein